MYYDKSLYGHSYLVHHGVKGQKWGVRRYQNSDGSLTPAGKKRYGFVGSTKAYIKRRQKNANDFYKKTGDYVHDKTRDQMTDKERKQFDEANADYKKAQKKAGVQYRKDLKKSISNAFNPDNHRHLKAYAEYQWTTAKERLMPSSLGQYSLHLLFGGGKEAYARGKGKEYVAKTYGFDEMRRVAYTDAALSAAGRIGKAMFDTWRANNPTYEVPRGYRG